MKSIEINNNDSGVGAYRRRRIAVLMSAAYRGGVRGLKPLPLAYDLRNKRVRMRQNMVFSTKSTKKFIGRAHPPPQTLPYWGRIPTPYPTRRLLHLDLSHSKILGTPLLNVAEAETRKWQRTAQMNDRMMRQLPSSRFSDGNASSRRSVTMHRGVIEPVVARPPTHRSRPLLSVLSPWPAPREISL